MNLPAASLINRVYLGKIASIVDLQNELQGELSVVIYYYVSDEKQRKHLKSMSRVSFDNELCPIYFASSC